MDIKDFMGAQERLAAGREAISYLVDQATAKLHHMEHVIEAVRGLRRCWKDEDPGKYGEHWFLVRGYEIEPGECFGFKKAGRAEKFWAIELVDNAFEAQLGRKARSYGPSDERRHVPLGKLAEARQEPCPHCQTPTAVVGRYCQTEDSPEGDLWQLDLSTLCLSCMTLDMFAKRIEEHRFF